MTPKLIPARTEGELIALKMAVREIARQVEVLSSGEPFQARALQRSLETLDALVGAMGNVDDVPQETRAYVETFLDTARSDLERIFSPSDTMGGFPMRH